MAFFALLGQHTAGSDQFTIKRCHVNIWSLPGWLGHRPMAFDVGVLIETGAPIRELEMALPVCAAPRVIDLSEALTDAGTSGLLFGGAFESTDQDVLRLKLDRDDPDHVSDIRIARVKEDDCTVNRIDGEQTTVKLTFSRPLKAGELSYLRVRFPVDDAGSMWRWQRVLGRRNGILIEFRAPDPRDERGASNSRRALLDRALPTEELEAFFMVPEQYRLQSCNPGLKYTRTLEGDAWEPYLRRSLNGMSGYFRPRKRMMVHRWHPETLEGEPHVVDRVHPFRGHLQFGWQPGFMAPSDLIINGLLLGILLIAMIGPVDAGERASEVASWLESATSALVDVIWWMLGGITVGILYLVVRRWRDFPRVLGWMKRQFKRAEFLWFKALK